MYASDQRLRLSPEDDFMHAIEAASNFNESMYFNLFDHGKKMGGWFRLGNRPNENHAEMTCCLYLPDGRVGFMYQRPELDHNDAFDAGGLQCEVVKAFEKLRLNYRGMICVLDDPQQMEDPRKAFSNNPILPCNVSLEFSNIGPAFGGEPVDENDQPVEIDAAASFARGHYEQHMAGSGSIHIGQEHFEISGFGLRDHSWGPRYWQNIHWYRWLPLVFSPDFAMVASVITLKDGSTTHWGVVMTRNAEGDIVNDEITHVDLVSDYDQLQQATSQSASIQTASGNTYNLTGKALTTIPLRNRRKDGQGNELHTRITEAMTEFHCNGMTGYGMAEYLDQMIDDRPVGYPR